MCFLHFVSLFGPYFVKTALIRYLTAAADVLREPAMNRPIKTWLPNMLQVWNQPKSARKRPLIHVICETPPTKYRDFPRLNKYDLFCDIKCFINHKSVVLLQYHICQHNFTFLCNLCTRFIFEWMVFKSTIRCRSSKGPYHDGNHSQMPGFVRGGCRPFPPISSLPTLTSLTRTTSLFHLPFPISKWFPATLQVV